MGNLQAQAQAHAQAQAQAAQAAQAAESGSSSSQAHSHPGPQTPKRPRLNLERTDLQQPLHIEVKKVTTNSQVLISCIENVY